MKAAGITDEQVFAVIDHVKATKGMWTCIWDLQEAFPNFPYKIIQAKMRQMVNKKRISGCGCGCRGDFERKRT